MHPTIRDGEIVTVGPAAGGTFAPGDVLLCRYDRGPTAHRVVSMQVSPAGAGVAAPAGRPSSTTDVPMPADKVIGRILTVQTRWE